MWLGRKFKQNKNEKWKSYTESTTINILCKVFLHITFFKFYRIYINGIIL